MNTPAAPTLLLEGLESQQADVPASVSTPAQATNSSVTSIEDGSIAILHLQNGTTLVGRIEEQTEDGFRLYRPCELIIGPDPQTGQMGFALTPWLSYGGVLPPLNTALVPYEMVIMPRKTPAPIEAYYQEKISGIVVPPKQSIITAV